MNNFKLTDQQQLLVEKLNNADLEIDQILTPDSPARRFQRPIYDQLAEAATDFLAASHGSEWIIMTGLRGVGKTTLLAQLYLHPKLKTVSKFYLSLDQAQFLGAEMQDVEKALAYKLNQPLPQVKEADIHFFR